MTLSYGYGDSPAQAVERAENEGLMTLERLVRVGLYGTGGEPSAANDATKT
jgi:hypothetical protein